MSAWSELKRRLRPARDVAASAAARLWEGSCAGVARLVPPVPAWTGSAGAPVLVIAPHPDDELYGCGGALLRHVAAGDPVTVCMLTDGRRSRALGLAPEAMAERRRAEADACAALCGFTLLWCGLPEGEATEAAMSAACAEALSAVAPKVVYAPSCVDFHPEHLKVARALSRAIADSAATVRVYGVQVPLTPLLTNLVVDLTAQIDLFERAVRTHASQAHHLAASLRVRRQTALLHQAGRYAEALWEMTPADYVAMQSRGLGGHFRALRPQPFSDPLGYVTGLRTRWRLRG